MSSQKSVVLTVQRQLDADQIAEALGDAGAEAMRIELGLGDTDRTIKRFFNFHFADPGQPAPQRAAQGFVSYPSEEFPEGWTHLRLGRDDRARHFILALAKALGGEFFDERTGEKIAFEAPVGFEAR